MKILAVNAIKNVTLSWLSLECRLKQFYIRNEISFLLDSKFIFISACINSDKNMRLKTLGNYVYIKML